MTVTLANPFRGQGFPGSDRRPAEVPETDAAGVAALLALCPKHAMTPLHDAPELARRAGVERVMLKDERSRMGLGSFKALGAAYVIAREAAAARTGEWAQALEGCTYVAASAGNHGLSVAAGARLFGARAIIYLSGNVPEAFAARLEAKGAEVVRLGATYEESMEAAARDAEAQGWTLLSDSSWPGYTEIPRRVMEGYLQLAAEAALQVPQRPTHILLQAGVGGMAAAVAAHARSVWGPMADIIVVEPDAAPGLIDSIRKGRLVSSHGPVSAMGRLDCKTPSMVALAGLSRDADSFMTISESDAARGVEVLRDLGFDTTPSGGAGIAALLAGVPGCGPKARVLAILSEGPEDA